MEMQCNSGNQGRCNLQLAIIWCQCYHWKVTNLYPFIHKTWSTIDMGALLFPTVDTTRWQRLGEKMFYDICRKIEALRKKILTSYKMETIITVKKGISITRYSCSYAMLIMSNCIFTA